jgi:hypothetical protein
VFLAERVLLFRVGFSALVTAVHYASDLVKLWRATHFHYGAVAATGVTATTYAGMVLHW